MTVLVEHRCRKKTEVRLLRLVHCVTPVQTAQTNIYTHSFKHTHHLQAGHPTSDDSASHDLVGRSWHQTQGHAWNCQLYRETLDKDPEKELTEVTKSSTGNGCMWFKHKAVFDTFSSI